MLSLGPSPTLLPEHDRPGDLRIWRVLAGTAWAGMGSFLCPRASRALLRPAARSLTCAGLKTGDGEAAATSTRRWFSSDISKGRTAAIAWHAGGQQATRPRGVAASIPNQPHGPGRAFFSPPRRILRRYEDLPHNYRDKYGLPFSNKELSEADAAGIFGPGINAAEANYLLRVLHGRRVAGTLDDPAFAVHTEHFTPDQMAQGLAYLRWSVPVEEVLNAGLRAEDELDRMEQDKKQVAEQAQPDDQKQQEGDQGKDANKMAEETTGETTGDTYRSNPLYGKSVLDEIRARNIARQKAHEKALEEERQAQGAVEGQPRGLSNPKIAKYYKEAQSDLKEPPEIRAWERILPSAVSTLLVLVFLVGVCSVYEEPTARYRLFREIPPSVATMATMTAVNALVFLAWRLPPLWKMLNRYMIMVVATPRPVTMFSAILSHTSLGHLACNLLVLWTIGTQLHEEIGRANLLTLFVACGSLGFVSGLTVYALRGMLTVSSLGGSGATMGLVAAYLWEHRNDKFRLLGMPPDGVHGIVLLALVAALQQVAASRVAKLRIDVVSHVAGMALGILGMEFINQSGGNRTMPVRRERGEKDVNETARRETFGGEKMG